jgi:hypothetical protein
MTYKEIKPLLPTKWEDIKLKDYLLISDAIVSTEDDLDPLEHQLQMVDNVFNIVSKLTGISLNELMTIDTKDISKVVLHMEFIFTDIVPNAVPHSKMKKDIDTTYANYITFTNLTADPANISQALPTIIQSFLIDVSADEVLELGMVEVMTIFFCQVRLLRKYMMTTRQSLLWTIIKQRAKQVKQATLSTLMFWKKSKG